MATERLKLSKKELSACSLTCKYWAKHLRRYIFRAITVRSREDWSTFVEFATSNIVKPNIGKFVEYFTLHQTVPSRPWVHLALICRPKGIFPSLHRLNVESQGASAMGAAPNSPLTLRSVYQDIPGSFPPLSADIAKFSLVNIHFSSFEDIMATVDSVACTTIYCQQLSWSNSDVLIPSYLPAAFSKVRRWRTSAKEVHIQQCAAYWPFLWMVVTTRPRGLHIKKSPLFVNPGELHRVFSLVQLACDNCSCSFCVKNGSQHSLFHPTSALAKPWYESCFLPCFASLGLVYTR